MAAKTTSSQKHLSVIPDEEYQKAIKSARDEFITASKVNGLSWQAESVFAMQACANNNKLREAANENPLSLTFAMNNVAAIGLSLNPALQFAFLVPRDGKVILDISYRGLLRIATDTGSILGAKAELVYTNDKFKYNGAFASPVHEFDPFDENRGELRGVYCKALTADNIIMVETMRLSELHMIRSLSNAYQYAERKGTICAYHNFEGELFKKIVLKRAFKTWPKTNIRVHEVVKYLNEEAGEGIDFGALAEKEIQPDVVVPTPDDKVSVRTRTMLEKLVARASETNEWVAAKVYLEDNLSSEDYAWACPKFESAQQAATQTMSTQTNQS